MASAEIAGHAHRAGGPEGPAQFWDDFWNTLYQFTHPFSSTFFDSVFGNDGDAAPSNPQAQGQQQEGQPGGSLGTGAGTGAGAGAGAGAARYFNDEASFEKFWHGLKHGAYHHDSHPSTLMEHAQAAWIDFKTAASGFISSVEWQQTWIQMILLLHVILFIIILVLRNRPNPLAAMLFCTSKDRPGMPAFFFGRHGLLPHKPTASRSTLAVNSSFSGLVRTTERDRKQALATLFRRQLL
ncbi:unnamed protein product [Mortierella alpina]